jgi:ribosomal protein L32
MLFLAVAAAIILGLIPAVIASEKGYSVRLWWLFGALLLPVVLPVVLLLPTTEKALRRREQDRARDEAFRECPSCHDDVRSEATVCPYCHFPVLPTRTAIGDVRSILEAAHQRRSRST